MGSFFNIMDKYLDRPFQKALDDQHTQNTCGQCLRALLECVCQTRSKLEWDVTGRIVWDQPYDMGSGV